MRMTFFMLWKPACLLQKVFLRRCPHLTGQRWFSKISTSKEMNRIRNIGIIAHIDAGKTTTTEHMLFYSGFSQHLGNVDDGDTVTDYMQQERDRGITISSAVVTLDWNKHRINLLDTPGHIDFTVEVERCLRVLDGTITVLDGAAGVEAQTLTVWRQAERYRIPSILYVNKMDKPYADFGLCVQSIQDKLHVKTVPIFVPLHCDRNSMEQLDVVGMNLLKWDLRKYPDGSQFDKERISPETNKALWEKLIHWRTYLVETIADFDSVIEEHVMCDTEIQDIPPLDLVRGLRRATLGRHVVPVLGGSSLRNMGIQPLLDSVCLYLPNPSDRNYEFTKFYGEDLCALAFKIIHHKDRGALTFMRIYSGSMKARANVYNVNQHLSEKVTRLLQVNADDFQDITVCGPGNIVCVTGLTSVRTGDTITSSQTTANRARKRMLALQPRNDPKSEDQLVTPCLDMGDVEDEESDEDGIRPDEAILAGVQIPPPVFFCSIEPPSMSTQRKMELALECIQREDPSLQVDFSTETSQTILSGMGELHLEIIKNRIIHEFKVDVELGPLQVAYRETIQGHDNIHEEILDTQIGSQHHNVSIKIAVSHCPHTEKFTRLKIIQSETLADVYWKHVKAIENGTKAALSGGPLLGYPVIDVEVSLLGFSVKRGTSLPMISACASQCVRNALKQADPQLMEPVMKMEISSEEQWLSTVLHDLTRKRSHVEAILDRKGVRVVQALTPLSELRGYSSSLRQLTSGSASFVMELSHFGFMTLDDQNKAVEMATGVTVT